VKVFLKNDIPRIGMAGEIITVEDGYARNYLIPRGFGIEVTTANEKFYAVRERHLEKRKEIVESKTSMLAERIKSIKLILKKKVHDDGKLYGSISPSEIVDELAKVGVNIAKNQVIFDKSIKSEGTFDVTIKLTSRLQPHIKVAVVPVK
jgi:large subunit ribosomal protein L9